MVPGLCHVVRAGGTLTLPFSPSVELEGLCTLEPSGRFLLVVDH